MISDIFASIASVEAVWGAQEHYLTLKSVWPILNLLTQT